MIFFWRGGGGGAGDGISSVREVLPFFRNGVQLWVSKQVRKD